MTSLENDGSNKQTAGHDVSEEVSVYEDEINLMDYFIVLWKWKWLILVSSILPTLVVGLTLFHSPRNYKVTYAYDLRNDIGDYTRDYTRDYIRDDIRDDISNWNLTEKNYNILISRFYSEENLTKIIKKLRESGLNEYAKQLSNGGSSKGLLKFEPIPSYIDLSEARITDVGQLEELRQLKALLLKMTIIGKPKNDIPGISAVIRDNLENVTPVYMAKEQLSTEIRTHRTLMADIEGNRFNWELTLKTNASALEKLKNVKTQIQDSIESNVTLQFDVGGKSEHLPLGYQIQALESEIVTLEKEIEVNEENYKYYKNLLALNEKLLAGLNKSIASYYTIQQYRSFLLKLIKGVEKQELKDYLSSYLKKIENRIAASVPVTEDPTIYPIARGTVKKSGIVFVIALMMSIFVSFLLEGLKKSQTPVS